MSKFRYDKVWYDSLKKPWFQPPAWVFAPAWTILYLLIFISFALILHAPYRLINVFAYAIFVLQLILNFSWSPVFFRQHQIKKAFFICLALAFTIFFMIILFYFVSKLAAIILIPYLLWVSFASLLNYRIWKLNPEAN